MNTIIRNISQILLIGLVIISCNKIDNKANVNNIDTLATVKKNIVETDTVDNKDFCSDGSMITEADMYSQGPDYVPYFINSDTCFNNCFQTWRTNGEWGDCINQHRHKWENLVNLYYDSLLLELDSKGQKILIEYQKNWTKHTNSEKELFNYFEDNTNCIGRETHFIGMNANMYRYRNRAVELYTYLYFIRGDKESKSNSEK